MLKSMTIRKIETEVHTKLKVMAAQENITLETLIAKILKAATEKKV